MPGLIGRTPKEAFETFRTHISALLNQTVTDAPITILAVPNNRANLATRRGDPIAAPLHAKDLFLYVGQIVQVEEQSDKTWKLKTLQYRYRIQATDSLADENSLRWEYVAREVRDAKFCRHHFQAGLEIELGDRKVSLRESHLPTGWVTIEEIIRFLIVEMNVKSNSSDWETVLRNSEEKFKEWTARDI